MNAVEHLHRTTPILQIRQSVHIERDIASVYALIANREATPTWNQLIRSTDRIDGEDGAVGSRYREIGRIGPLRVHYTTTIVEAIPPIRLTAESESSSVSLRWGFNLTPDGTGTHLDLWSDVVRLRGPVRLLQPLMGKMMPRGASANLDRVRSLMEMGEGEELTSRDTLR